MTERFDVTTRLAEGRPAVDHLQRYVRACEVLGYQQPDLTAHASQVGDWYETEVGLDLRALDDDVTTLRAAVTAIVDGKVATTVAIDERSAAERSTWLAAAQAVTAGDHSAAEVIVHRHVMPFVDNDIRNDWLAAMSSANASIAASYDAAIHALASTAEVRFDIPGDLSPRQHPDEQPVPAAPPPIPLPASPLSASPLPTVPAGVPGFAAPQPTTDAAQPLPADEPEETPPTPLDPLGDAAGLSTGSGGLGGLGGVTGGIGGIVSGIVDSIGSLLSSLTDGLGNNGLGDTEDPPGVDDDGDPDDGEPVVDDDDTPDGAKDVAEPASVVGDPTPEAATAESPSAPAEPVAEPAAGPVGQPSPEATQTADQPSAVAPPDGSTPCEIAEDQLPQAGQ